MTIRRSCGDGLLRAGQGPRGGRLSHPRAAKHRHGPGALGALLLVGAAAERAAFRRAGDRRLQPSVRTNSNMKKCHL